MTSCTSNRSWQTCIKSASSSSSSCTWCVENLSCVDSKFSHQMCVNGNSCSSDESCANVLDYSFGGGNTGIGPGIDDSLFMGSSSNSFNWKMPFCANNGVIEWGLLGSNLVGGTQCVCPEGWTGAYCDICANDSVCTNGKNTKCKRKIDVDDNIISCKCDSPFCKRIGFGPDLGSVSVTIHKTSPGVYHAGISILKAVDFPSKEKLIVPSPYLISAKLTDCVKPIGEIVKCSSACGANKCPTGVPWGEDDVCVYWKCTNERLTKAKEPSSVCPPLLESWAVNAQFCPVVKSVITKDYSFICTMPNENSSDIRCAFATGSLPLGQLSLQCQVGRCGPPDNNSNDNATTIHDLPWCERNAQYCLNIQYSLIVLLPLAFFLILMLGFIRNKRKQRIIEIRLLESLGTSSSSLSSRVEISSSAVDNELHSIDNMMDRGLLQDQQAVAQPSILTFTGIKYGINEPKGFFCSSSKAGNFRQVIQNIDGSVGPELMAILGPSGSGKTSFIDIISGRKNQGIVQGTVYINGAITSRAERRRRIGYVMQDDHSLPGTSTVREYLMFHANLRMSNRTLLQRCERIQEVIETLGLKLASDSLIGDSFRKGISGGEKRRVSIAVEILAHSELLVLDEPTSGLDSSSTRSVIEALKTIVKLGQGVVMSIHQPGSQLWANFDRILLLSSQGQTLFCGPRIELMRFMESQDVRMPENYNPAEYYLDVAVDTQLSSRISEAYLSSTFYQNEMRVVEEFSNNNSSQQLPSHEQQVKQVPWIVKVHYLCMRNIQKIVRHPVHASVNFFATILVAITAGCLYGGVSNELEGFMNRAGLFFFTLTYLMLVALVDLGVWQEERIMFMREREVYEPSAFLFSKIVAELLPLRLLPLSLYTVILTWAVGLNKEPTAVVILFLTLLMVSLISTLLFLSLGMLLKSNGVANFAAVLLTMYSLLMSSFLLHFNEDGDNSLTWNYLLQKLQFFSVLYFGFEILMVSEMNGLDFNVVVKNQDGVEIGQWGATGDLLNRNLGLKYGNFSRDVTSLGIYFCALVIITGLLLQFHVKEKR